MPGWPDRDQEIDDNGLKPGECKASKQKEQEEAMKPKEEQEKDAAAKAEQSVTKEGKLVDIDDKGNACKGEKPDRPHHPDPPMDPKKIYHIKPGQKGPVKPLRNVKGGGAKILALLKVGAKVRVDHLQSEEGLKMNGQTGRITSIDAADEQFFVVTEDGTQAKVPAETLTPVHPDPEGDAERARIEQEEGPREPGMT